MFRSLIPRLPTFRSGAYLKDEPILALTYIANFHLNNPAEVPSFLPVRVIGRDRKSLTQCYWRLKVFCDEDCLFTDLANRLIQVGKSKEREKLIFLWSHLRSVQCLWKKCWDSHCTQLLDLVCLLDNQSSRVFQLKAINWKRSCKQELQNIIF